MKKEISKFLNTQKEKTRKIKWAPKVAARKEKVIPGKANNFTPVLKNIL